MGDWLTALEATTLARSLRDSVWAYPLVNAGHLLGVGLLVGAIVPLDLRLLNLWRQVPLDPLWRVLTQAAGAGLALAVLFGLLLFITRATEYAASGFFLGKMAFVGIAAANAFALRRTRFDEPPDMRSNAAPAPFRLRVAAAISLAAWLAALLLGRLVGYF